MRVAITGATGFLGHYIVSRLASQGHECRCWFRSTTRRDDFGGAEQRVQWIPGGLGDEESCDLLVDGCDAVVHAALDRPGAGFRGAEGDLPTFLQNNVIGTIQLIEAAREKKVPRFVFISSCSVHDKILSDRPLDETHPTWSTSHYGAHKAAIEAFVHSYGYGEGYDICALRPTGIYGVAHPVEDSKWYSLVKSVVRGQTVRCERGGKEVHAADVAKAVELLLTAPGIAGEAYNCCDRYVSDYDVATLVKDIAGSNATIEGKPTQPRNQIATEKIRSLGMTFGGEALLRETLRELVDVVKRS